MAETFETKITRVAVAYKRILRLKITDSSLSTAIEENPYYPSLYAISDTFERYNIGTAAYNVRSDQFEELNAPFIAWLDIPFVGNDFVLVTEITDDTVSYLYDKRRPVTVEKEIFFSHFKNVALLAEANDDCEEKDYPSQLKKEQRIKNKNYIWFSAIIAIILSLVALNITSNIAVALATISTLKITGFLFTCFLIAYEIDKRNSVVKSLCSVGGKTNCDAILGSKAAKIAGISWSEIGFFYFAISSAILFAPGLAFQYKTILFSSMNALAVPYIAFSIYYQSFIAKQWCPLCIGVQVILAGELIWSIVYFWAGPHSFVPLLSNGTLSLLYIFVLIILPMVAWYGLKPYFLISKDYDSVKSAFARLQNSPEIFNSLLIQQPKAADGWQHLGIDFGNPEASNTVIGVCSVSCGPCAEIHPKLVRMIKGNKNINLKIIFTVGEDESDYKIPIVKHFMSMSAHADVEKIESALEEWYLSSTQNYNILAAKYPVNGEVLGLTEKVEAMRNWCNRSEINYTPTIFVNGYRLPENYDVERLTYIL